MGLGDHSRSRLKGATDAPICLLFVLGSSVLGVSNLQASVTRQHLDSQHLYFCLRRYSPVLEEPFFLGHRGMSNG